MPVRDRCSPIALLILLSWPGASQAAAAEPALGSPDYYPSAERPIGWRGDGTGHYPGATPVTSFAEGPVTKEPVAKREKVGLPKPDKRTGKHRPQPIVGDGPSENIVWATRMPGWAHSQPIIVGDKAFTMAEPSSLVCVDMHSGEILWQAANNPWELAGVPTEEAKRIEDYVAHLYAARGPWMSVIGNYQRMIGKRYWKPELMPRIKALLDTSETIFTRLVEQHPDGAKAAEALATFKKLKKQVLAATDGNFKKGIARDINQQFFKAAEWIVKEYQIPVMYGWDGFIGWTFATPISDGQRVYCSMGQGQVVAYDLDGKRLWGQRIEHLDKEGKPLTKGGRHGPRVKAKHVPSPLLVDGVLVVQAPDQLVGLDAATGKILWKEPKVSVNNYNVSTGTIVTLKSGRLVIATPRWRILDPKTGENVGGLPGGTYGAEGAGASMVTRDGILYYYMAGKGKEWRKSALVAVQLKEDGDKVIATELWRNDKCRTTGHTPVLTPEWIYTFNSDMVIDLTDGSLVPKPAQRGYRTRLDIKDVSPILAGKVAFSYDNGTPRSARVDKRQIFKVTTSTLRKDGHLSYADLDNYFDETPPPPHPYVASAGPEIYAGVAADTEPLLWSNRAWPAPMYFGNCGALPSKTGAGGFCASGNRVVMRTLSRLICIGDPTQQYDWNPDSRQ